MEGKDPSGGELQDRTVDLCGDPSGSKGPIGDCRAVTPSCAVALLGASAVEASFRQSRRTEVSGHQEMVRTAPGDAHIHRW